MKEVKISSVRIQAFLHEQNILPIRLEKMMAFYEDTTDLRKALIYFMTMTEYGFY